MARGVDFSEFKKYAENWHRSYKELYAFLTTFLLEMAERTIGKTKDRTPVGTPESTGIPGYVGGALRESWQLGEIRGSGRNLEIEILNGMEYASFVEYGHRKPPTENDPRDFIPGRLMLTISLDEIYAQMPLRFNKAFKEFLAERGIE